MIRYAVTYINKDGYRKLIHAAQGRYMHRTRWDAEQALRDMLTNNSSSRMTGLGDGCSHELS